MKMKLSSRTSYQRGYSPLMKLIMAVKERFISKTPVAEPQKYIRVIEKADVVWRTSTAPMRITYSVHSNLWISPK